MLDTSGVVELGDMINVEVYGGGDVDIRFVPEEIFERAELDEVICGVEIGELIVLEEEEETKVLLNA